MKFIFNIFAFSLIFSSCSNHSNEKTINGLVSKIQKASIDKEFNNFVSLNYYDKHIIDYFISAHNLINDTYPKEGLSIKYDGCENFLFCDICEDGLSQLTENILSGCVEDENCNFSNNQDAHIRLINFINEYEKWILEKLEIEDIEEIDRDNLDFSMDFNNRFLTYNNEVLISQLDFFNEIKRLKPSQFYFHPNYSSFTWDDLSFFVIEEKENYFFQLCYFF